MNEKSILIKDILYNICSLLNKNIFAVETDKELYLKPLHSDPFNLCHLDYIYLLIALEKKYRIDFLTNADVEHIFFNILNIADFISKNKSGGGLNDRSYKVE